MDEQNLLSRLRHGDEQALAAAITQYSAYVVTVIHNRSRGLLSPEDEDELASSVFFTLWQSCRTVKAGHLRAWLGSVARNKTVDRLRKSRCEVPLDEPERTIFFLRKPRSENRRSSSVPPSRSYPRQTARSSAGFMIYVNQQSRSPPHLG